MYSSDRIIHLMANGVLVFSPSVPNMHRVFSDQEIVYFDNDDDFIKKLNYYVSNDKEYNTIAMCGYTKAHAAYNEKRIMRFVIETIYQYPHKERYEWHF